jgi:hypothetical protein
MLVAVRWSCQFTFRGFSLPRHRPQGQFAGGPNRWGSRSVLSFSPPIEPIGGGFRLKRAGPNRANRARNEYT